MAQSNTNRAMREPIPQPARDRSAARPPEAIGFAWAAAAAFIQADLAWPDVPDLVLDDMPSPD
jgi:hypothetical protein